MIRFVKTLPDLKANKISLAKILALYKAFGGTSLSPDFWVQESEGNLTAALCLYGSEMTVYCHNANLEELRDFIRVVSPKSVFTEKENVLFEASVLKAVFLKELPINTSFAENKAPLKDLYHKLCLGCDGDVCLPSFEVFAPDVSHRLRHNSASAITSDFGAALCFTFDGGGVISGISVDKNLRQKGLGSKMLNEISSLVGGKIFACTQKENQEFYIKNGFTLIGEAAIIEMERA